MKCLALAAAVILFAGCGTSEKPADAAAPPAMNLADMAGTWAVKTMAMDSDSVLVSYTMKATAADTGWMIMLPDRPAMAVQVMVMGDSIMTNAGPYESVLRKGVTVSTSGIIHLKDGMLTGTTVATYSKGPDSVRTLRISGTKQP